MIDGIRVIDFHGHVGRWDQFGMNDDPAQMLHAMDSVGIDVSCVFSIFHPDGITANDRVARFIARHPDRFLGFAYVSPLMPEHMIEELTRGIDEMGFVAIKLYPKYTSWPFNQEPWYPIYEFADNRGLTVILHTNMSENCRPRFLEDIAPQFPEARFVAGHSGNFPIARKEAIAAAQKCPNVYLETSSTFRTAA